MLRGHEFMVLERERRGKGGRDRERRATKKHRDSQEEFSLFVILLSTYIIT